MRRQQPVDARPRHAEALGYLGSAQTLRFERADLGGLNRPRTALVDTLRLRSRNPFHLTLATQVGLELGEHAQHVEKRLPGGSRRIYRLFGRLERRALGPKLANDVLEVADRPGQPVYARDRQHVAVPDEVEDSAQLVAPRSRCAASLLGPNHVAARPLERRDLHVEVLLEGAERDALPVSTCRLAEVYPKETARSSPAEAMESPEWSSTEVAKKSAGGRAAAVFVNPLTSLGMTETMRREGHTALVHTADCRGFEPRPDAEQNLHKDKIPLVNIVRNEEQAKLLRGIGATYVCNSTAPAFMNDLTEAVSATGATIAFDAIGGGKLASQTSAARKMTEYSRYGSSVFKQVYIYGGLDTGPTELTRSFGLSWSVSGWLLTPFLMKSGPAETQNLRDRVARELKTTFASHYTRVVSLQGALKPEAIAAYAKRATGEKYLINPSLGA